jgi:5-hydroxyisourate hydrolase
MPTIAEINRRDRMAFCAALVAIYERSPRLAERAYAERPFASLNALAHAMQEEVERAGGAAQLALVRAHPELAGQEATAGMRTELAILEGASGPLLKTARTDAPLAEGATFVPGRDRLVFEVGAYFRARGLELSEPPFLERVALRLGIADPQAHDHVPLLVSPWSYATYRGS